jgi:hypothetical protein
MKKLSKRGAVMFGAAFAICAFVLPSMASAASWGVVGTEHTLTATGLGFTADVSPTLQVGAQCADSRFTVDVRSAAVITITSATFNNCTGTGAGAGCFVTAHGTNFHWTATGITTSNVQIHGIDIDNSFSGASCPALVNGSSARLTGTLTGGRWTGNAAGQHSITLAASHGLVAHSALFGTVPATINDQLVVDLQQTITLS